MRKEEELRGKLGYGAFLSKINEAGLFVIGQLINSCAVENRRISHRLLAIIRYEIPNAEPGDIKNDGWAGLGRVNVS